MKKLIFAIALGGMTFVSASTGEVLKSVVTTPKNIETKNAEKQETKALASWDCVRVSYGCGTTGWACGASTFEIIMNAWNAYDIACAD